MTAADAPVSYRKTQVGTSRSFGFVFAVFFGLLSVSPLLHHGHFRLWALIVAAAFLAVALVAPRLLQPLNMVWFKLGLLLHHVVNPVVMSLIFWLTVVPVGLIARAMGKDFLRLKFDKNAASYWIVRDPPGPAPGSMARQF